MLRRIFEDENMERVFDLIFFLVRFYYGYEMLKCVHSFRHKRCVSTQ